MPAFTEMLNYTRNGKEHTSPVDTGEPVVFHASGGLVFTIHEDRITIKDSVTSRVREISFEEVFDDE